VEHFATNTLSLIKLTLFMMKKELIFSLVGYVGVLIPAYIMGLWIYLSTRTDLFDFDDVKSEYLSYFPTALANGKLLGAISIGLLGLSIFFLNMANSPFISSGWRITNKVLIVLAGVLLVWQLWTLM